MSAGAGPRFEVRVVDEVLTEDLARCTPAARAAIEPMVATLRDSGAPSEWLLRCEAEGQDGTQLGGCVKLYIPRPAGQWGAVLTGDEEAKKPALVLIAVGERHRRGRGSRACTRSRIDGFTSRSARRLMPGLPPG